MTQTGPRTLTHEEARAFYDRLGSRQDSQGFYEDVATAELVRHAGFEEATRVLEFGCGTGRFAETLLTERLASSAKWTGVDASSTMVELTRERLQRFGPRVEVRHTDGSPVLPFGDASFDRVVSNYVLDLLSGDDIRSFVREAHRVLAPGGRLALVSLTHGSGFGRVVETIWTRLHGWRPQLVGGCRPIELLDFLDDRPWHLLHRGRVQRFGICSEVVVAERHASG